MSRKKLINLGFGDERRDINVSYYYYNFSLTLMLLIPAPDLEFLLHPGTGSSAEMPEANLSFGAPSGTEGLSQVRSSCLFIEDNARP